MFTIYQKLFYNRNILWASPTHWLFFIILLERQGEGNEDELPPAPPTPEEKQQEILVKTPNSCMKKNAQSSKMASVNAYGHCIFGLYGFAVSSTNLSWQEMGAQSKIFPQAMEVCGMSFFICIFSISLEKNNPCFYI